MYGLEPLSTGFLWPIKRCRPIERGISTLLHPFVVTTRDLYSQRLLVLPIFTSTLIKIDCITSNAACTKRTQPHPNVWNGVLHRSKWIFPFMQPLALDRRLYPLITGVRPMSPAAEIDANCLKKFFMFVCRRTREMSFVQFRLVAVCGCLFADLVWLTL